MTLGILVVAPGGRVRFQYAFTPPDVVWLARLLTAASSGPSRAPLRAILWRALARFAWSGQGRGSLAAFIQRLEPSLPRVPWTQMPQRARSLALSAGRGHLRRRQPNAALQVTPRDGYAAPGYASGAPPSYGWSGETEMETAPGAPPIEQPAAPGAGTPVMAAAPGDTAMGADGGSGQGGDESPIDDGAMEPPPTADEPLPLPSSFDTLDGNRLDVNPNWLQSLMRSWRRNPRWWRRSGWHQGYSGAPHWRMRYPPYPSARVPYAPSYAGYQPWRAPAPGGVVVGRLRNLARNARRVGTLRAVRSGRRYPVFGGTVAGRNFRIITRQRSGLRHEIMAVRGNELQQELAR